MSENPITPSNSGEENPNSPEQISDQSQAALEELARSHDELKQRLDAKESELAELRAQVANLQTQGDSSPTETASAESPVESAEKETKEQKSDSQRDLERLSKITGRPVDDPDLLKLNLRLKAERFAQLTASYDAQAGTVRQEGFMQDVATAKRELEEAMYLYDPKFAEMDEQEARTKALYERTTDPEEKAKLRQELFRLRDHGSVGDGNEERPGGTPRRDAADQLAGRLADIARSLDGSEILATYQLNSLQYPEEPINSRRRTDTKDWRGKPEFENGVYVGSSPERTGEWVLEPKAPLSSKGEEKTGESAVPDSGESQSTEAEGAEKQGDSLEAMSLVEVPSVDPGMYPEYYAKMKNLTGGDAEKLNQEKDRVAAEITANVQARVNNFLVENPDATPEQIRQFTSSCYVEARNDIDADIIDAIDGKGYTNASGEVIGRSPARRFGAWMDRNGGKLKKGMLIAGGIGAVVMTGGMLAGAFAPVFAIGAGTAIGAAKGAVVGLTMSRQGSKESYARNVEVSDETFEKMLKEMDPADLTSFVMMSDHMMTKFNEAADKDHNQNVRKSRRSAVIGAVLGGLFGSLHFNSTHQIETPQKVTVPNDPPKLPTDVAPIAKGELTGQVLDRVLNQAGMQHEPFTLPDGSTNSALIKEILGNTYDKVWHGSAGGGGTHSYAGASPYANAGINAVLNAVAKSSAGTHLETIYQAVSSTFTNIPATIGGWLTGLLLTGAATRQAAESVTNTGASEQTEVVEPEPKAEEPVNEVESSETEPVAPVPSPAPSPQPAPSSGTQPQTA